MVVVASAAHAAQAAKKEFAKGRSACAGVCVCVCGGVGVCVCVRACVCGVRARARAYVCGVCAYACGVRVQCVFQLCSRTSKFSHLVTATQRHCHAAASHRRW
jgi:hypothetical protein